LVEPVLDRPLNAHARDQQNSAGLAPQGLEAVQNSPNEGRPWFATRDLDRDPGAPLLEEPGPAGFDLRRGQPAPRAAKALVEERIRREQGKLQCARKDGGGLG
jgi:hypothetical protein